MYIGWEELSNMVIRCLKAWKDDYNDKLEISNLFINLIFVQRYCKMWHLNVISDKTKIFISNKGRSNVDFFVNYGDINLEIVDNYLIVFWTS